MSAHPPMRRTLSIVVLLLAASAVSALAATVETGAHRKASTYSHRYRHSSSHSAVKHSSTYSRTHTAGRATIHSAHYAPRRTSTYSRSGYSARSGSHRSSGADKTSYDSGRAAVIRKIAAAEIELNSRHTGVSRTAEVASLRDTPVPQPVSGPTASRAAYEAPTADRQPIAAAQPVVAQPSDSPSAGVSNPEAASPEAPSPADSTHQLSPGAASEMPFTHDAAGAPTPQAASQPAAADAAAADQPESVGTARELTHENVESDTPPPTQVASLDLHSAGMPSTLRGSLASLERQNSMLESEGLERILDEDDLASRIHHGLLVPVPVSAELAVNPSLIENHRYCRPWTARFLTDLSRAHAAAFHHPLQVNSAVRTVQYQTHLMRVNANAAAAEGEIVSPHLTGATIDIAKQGMNHRELVWMRRHLLAIQDAGKIDVEEEFRQACFHITVYKNYSSSAPSHKAAQPAVRDAANQHKSSPGSSLPTSIAAGTLVPHGR